MNKYLNFILPLKPKSLQSVRFAKLHCYQPKEIDTYKKNINLLISNQLSDDFEMFEKHIPLKVFVYYLYKKNNIKENSIIPKTTVPDVCDNLNKPLIDAMKSIVFHDDNQIFYFTAAKYWSNRNEIRISISEQYNTNMLK